MMGSPSLIINRPTCRWLGWGILAVVLAGCGGKNYTPPADADPALAKTALEKALDCWRLRIAPEELKAADPPIVVNDFDWQGGRRLMEFQLLPGEESVGINVRWPVRLRLVHADSREEIVDVVYIISTSPSIHIARAD